MNNRCLCEHESHFDGSDHGYLVPIVGNAIARYVGRVCDKCATGHLSDYIV